jgi:hypothetical protein
MIGITPTGLICGFDQQSPARMALPIGAVDEYADYLQTHRWYGAPGSDHHGNGKIHSSLAHVYERPRSWIEPSIVVAGVVPSKKPLTGWCRGFGQA